ncbi:MAG: hypothetical protein LQ351_002056 [Letrouitia transgressa]|nr:MAG: hypothetical protein LQ351_002056 [Letrouitia transgressa]
MPMGPHPPRSPPSAPAGQPPQQRSILSILPLSQSIESSPAQAMTGRGTTDASVAKTRPALQGLQVFLSTPHQSNPAHAQRDSRPLSLLCTDWTLTKTAILSRPPASDYFLLPSIKGPPVESSHRAPLPTPSTASTYKLPFLDFSTSQAAQAGQYWPGATASVPAIGIPVSNTLPTPPTTESDVFKPPGDNRDSKFRAAAVAAGQQSAMSATADSTGTSSSLTARRSAASNLPSFELPPPPAIPQKYMPYSGANVTQTTPAMVSVGNLLTPPTNIPGDSLSPVSSGVNGAGPATQGVAPYTPTGQFWPPPPQATNPFSLSTGTTPQPWNQGPANPLGPARGVFSPSLNSLVRNNSNSPTTTEGLPPPPFDLNQLPPFPPAVSLSSPGSLPAVAAQQQQVMAQAYMNVQTPVSATTTQQSPVSAPEPYTQRPPPTPTYYSGSQPSSTPQNSQFPAFNNPSPVQHSPLSATTPQGSRISPINNQAPGMQQPSSQQGSTFVRPYGSYSLPAMNGPIMTNIHSPQNQMPMMAMHQGLPGGLMHGYNSGHSASMQQLYTGSQPTPHNERPFKCDQCPQSFNRNHDLKRHKRIHLAVKPFPCGHCDKSFSRKDALKVRCACLLGK